MNERVLKVEKSTWLNLIGSVPADEEFLKWSSQDKSSWLLDSMHYLFIPRKSISQHYYTIWIAVDLEVAAGRQLINEVLNYLVIRISIFILHYFLLLNNFVLKKLVGIKF